MNLAHMKYAVVIAETKSINKAAELLYVGAPTLSRAVKELEAGLHVTLFDRSAKGMFLTPEGERFTRYAKDVLRQVEDIETMFNGDKGGEKHFSISVPRASYISDAFAKFSRLLDKHIEAEIIYKETDAARAIRSILQEDYRLAVIRYRENYDRYYKTIMDERGINYELVARFRYVLLMNEKNPLADGDTVTFDMLKDYIEITHPGTRIPIKTISGFKTEELPVCSNRRIYVFERGSQLELLSQNPETFMWVTPIPESLLKRYGLVQRQCEKDRRVYRDVLIHRKNYSLSALDRLFVHQLMLAKQKILAPVLLDE